MKPFMGLGEKHVFQVVCKVLLAASRESPQGVIALIFI